VSAILLLVVLAGIYLYFKNRMPASSKQTASQVSFVPAKPPVISPLPASSAGLSADAKKAFDERSAWTPVSIGNQPTLKGQEQMMPLPAGWSAREDYLLTVVPQTLPGAIRNYRAIIMRPAKPTSPADAIYTVPDTSNPYFKDHCHITDAPAGVCYGGTNPATKHVFDLMFFFE